MQTAKARGFKKGDFVYTGLFPAILIGDVHTTTPLCEVWGIEHETGSVYAHDLVLVTFEAFLAMAKSYGFEKNPPSSAVAREAIGGRHAESR